MKVVKTIKSFRQLRPSLSNSLGFVPTMGALHAGHESLIKESKNLCTNTCVSIFVNPLQFSEGEDFDTYPSNLKDDVKTLEQQNVDVLFLPSADEIYKKSSSFSIKEDFLSTVLEGSSRPHFFHGVMTVVMKLLNIVSPSHAFFGKKDFQQMLLIEKMIADFNLPVDLVRCETLRNKQGLAYSSRNRYLSKEGCINASNVFKTLRLCLSKNTNKELIESEIQSLPGVMLDYFVYVDNKTLRPITKNHSCFLVCIAFYVEGVRLIDNVEIN